MGLFLKGYINEQVACSHSDRVARLLAVTVGMRLVNRAFARPDASWPCITSRGVQVSVSPAGANRRGVTPTRLPVYSCQCTASGFPRCSWTASISLSRRRLSSLSKVAPYRPHTTGAHLRVMLPQSRHSGLGPRPIRQSFWQFDLVCCLLTSSMGLRGSGRWRSSVASIFWLGVQVIDAFPRQVHPLPLVGLWLPGACCRGRGRRAW